MNRALNCSCSCRRSCSTRCASKISSMLTFIQTKKRECYQEWIHKESKSSYSKPNFHKSP
ncbi:hypothetical protein E2C01_062580 [Portunus trituberculatus]|uniref:Uncharacterized protein n=1 Tax=Portunus trituberculatus TaxID=210409 RepID=A0A5B7H898_PORTR|nr:hypothetical protein [Portunus trituberculatus]